MDAHGCLFRIKYEGTLIHLISITIENIQAKFLSVRLFLGGTTWFHPKVWPHIMKIGIHLHGVIFGVLVRPQSPHLVPFSLLHVRNSFHRGKALHYQ